jgi:predicted permease
MIRKTLRALLRRDQFEDGLDAELRHHIELRTADLVRSGLSPDAAQRQARLELGSRERYKDEARTAFGLRWLDDLQHDARYALRSLRRSPGFAITAILSMALGVGANTIVFSVVNSLLFRPLPVQQSERLLFVNQGSSSNQSFPAYRDLRDRAQTIDGAIAYRLSRIAVGDAQSAEKYWGYLATGNYFDFLGLQPAVGRFFHAEDEKGPNASPFAVLSYDFWQTRFHGDPQIAGQTVRVNAEPYTILGVAPRGFRGTEAAIDPAIWVPMMQQPRIEGRSWLEERGSQNSWVLVRAKANANIATVEGDLNRVASEVARELGREMGPRLILSKPGLIGNTLRGPIEQFGMAMVFLAGLVLLAACINLAALLGARSADRFREIALRVSIGAGRGRIVRQLLTESIVLTALSGLAGGALAWILLRYLSQWRPPLEVSMQIDVHPDLRVLLFSATASILTGLIAGMAPALQAWKLHTSEALKGPAIRRGSRWTFRDASLFAQTALCCVLVISSLVAARGLASVFTARPGMDPAGVSVLSFDTVLAGYSTPDSLRFQRRALDAVAQLPGVFSAAYANAVPLSSDQSNTTVFREDAAQPFRLEQGRRVAYYNVSPGYFRTAGTRLLAGRDYAWNESPTAAVAIVNETLARQLFGTTNAVGRHLRFGGPLVEVIGVVEDGKYFTFSEDPRPVVFRQVTRGTASETTLVVRSSLPEAVTAASMLRAVKALDPALPTYGVGSMRENMALALLPAQIAVVALGSLGTLALMLAVTGIYGLASYSVSRRVREIGIRMAIGARPGQVLQSVLGRLAIIVAAGSLAGIALGLLSGRVLSAVVYQASPRDPLTLAAVGAIMGIVAIASALGPIRRAISIDPTRALRED